MAQQTAMAVGPLEAIGRLAELVNSDRSLVHRGRYVTNDIMIEIGNVSHYVRIDKGQIASLQRGPLLMHSWSFAIRGKEQAWRTFWQALPPPFFHDIFALAKRGEFRIEGDYKSLMTNLLYYKDVIAAPRRLAKETC